MKKESGFTLMELMIVVAIIGILSAIATPNVIAWRNNQQFNSGVRLVKSTIENMRMYAIRTNMPARVDFTAGTDSFKTVKYNMFTSDYDAPQTHQLPSQVIVGNTTLIGNQLQYTSRGIPLNAQGGDITLENTKHTLCRRIEISNVGVSRILECP